MGCDIHFYVETRGANGKWECQDKIHKDSTGEFQLLEQFGDMEAKFRRGSEPPHKYIDRDYFLFAILADVRNDYPDEKKIRYIAEPRGIPENISAEVKAVFDSWGEDGHSHSWFLLPEVTEWPHWDDEITYEDSDITSSGTIVRRPVTTTLRKRCTSFLDKVLKPMSKLCKDPNNVRMVFCFDN
jgi:hypothetical protein